MSHAYTLQGNITGVYNSATNALEQFTDYYPYGLPHASATSPEANRRKYGAKELTIDHGLNLYDFAARFQNPAFPHFTTPDPLAEDFKGVSLYIFCNGDPINLIDPTGLHVYKYSEDGTLVDFEENENYDVVYIVDSNDIILFASERYEFGTINYVPKESDTDAYIESSDKQASISLFEFFSDHTNIEWAITGVVDISNESNNIITTSHKEKEEGNMMKVLDAKYGISKSENSLLSITYYFHSHPNGNPSPSGILDPIKVRRERPSDLYLATLLFKRWKYEPEFMIYIPGGFLLTSEKTYIDYTRNSTPESISKKSPYYYYLVNKFNQIMFPNN